MRRARGMRRRMRRRSCSRRSMRLRAHMLTPLCALSPSADSSYLVYPPPVPSHCPTRHPPSAQSPHWRLCTHTHLEWCHAVWQSPLLLHALAQCHQLYPGAQGALRLPRAQRAPASSSRPPPTRATVIPVWSVPGAEKPNQFRRGTRETKIYF